MGFNGFFLTGQNDKGCFLKSRIYKDRQTEWIELKT